MKIAEWYSAPVTRPKLFTPCDDGQLQQEWLHLFWVQCTVKFKVYVYSRSIQVTPSPDHECMHSNTIIRYLSCTTVPLLLAAALISSKLRSMQLFDTKYNTAAFSKSHGNSTIFYATFKNRVSMSTFDWLGRESRDMSAYLWEECSLPWCPYVKSVIDTYDQSNTLVISYAQDKQWSLQHQSFHASHISTLWSCTVSLVTGICKEWNLKWLAISKRLLQHREMSSLKAAHQVQAIHHFVLKNSWKTKFFFRCCPGCAKGASQGMQIC